MKKPTKRSRGKAIVVYGAITIVGATALSTGVALGLLINTHSYMHAPAVNGSRAAAIATNPRTYALSGTASPYKQ